MTPDTPDVPTLLDAMAEQARHLLQSRGVEHPIVVGIHSGVWVAEHLRERLGVRTSTGAA